MTEQHFVDQKELIGIVSAKPQNFAWFLGAGASRSAGLPSATDLLWDLKRNYYCREENQEITRQDIQNDAVRDRIQSFMESRGFPAEWADQEYETYFEKLFGGDKEKHPACGRQSPACSRASRYGGTDLAGPLPRCLQHEFRHRR
jgi:hypothetical protein